MISRWTRPPPTTFSRMFNLIKVIAPHGHVKVILFIADRCIIALGMDVTLVVAAVHDALHSLQAFLGSLKVGVDTSFVKTLVIIILRPGTYLRAML